MQDLEGRATRGLAWTPRPPVRMRCDICSLEVDPDSDGCPRCLPARARAERESALRVIDPAHHWTAQLGPDRERAVIALERIRLGVAGLEVDLETKMPLIRTVSAVCEAPDAATARQEYGQLTSRLAGYAPLVHDLDPFIRVIEELLKR
jgi:hypothetical protein